MPIKLAFSILNLANSQYIAAFVLFFLIHGQCRVFCQWPQQTFLYKGKTTFRAALVKMNSELENNSNEHLV